MEPKVGAIVAGAPKGEAAGAAAEAPKLKVDLVGSLEGAPKADVAVAVAPNVAAVVAAVPKAGVEVFEAAAPNWKGEPAAAGAVDLAPKENDGAAAELVVVVEPKDGTEAVVAVAEAPKENEGAAAVDAAAAVVAEVAPKEKSPVPATSLGPSELTAGLEPKLKLGPVVAAVVVEGAAPKAKAGAASVVAGAVVLGAPKEKSPAAGLGASAVAAAEVAAKVNGLTAAVVAP